MINIKGSKIFINRGEAKKYCNGDVICKTKQAV